MSTSPGSAGGVGEGDPLATAPDGLLAGSVTSELVATLANAEAAVALV